MDPLFEAICGGETLGPDALSSEVADRGDLSAVFDFSFALVIALGFGTGLGAVVLVCMVVVDP